MSNLFLWDIHNGLLVKSADKKVILGHIDYMYAPISFIARQGVEYTAAQLREIAEVLDNIRFYVGMAHGDTELIGTKSADQR
jgi:hypothetical protein